MRNLLILLLLGSFIATTNAQELDSLKAIMGMDQEIEEVESAEEVESDEENVFAPVKVEENEDEVKVIVMDKEVVKVIESGDSTVVKLGDKGIVRVIEQPDSTRIRVGDKEISIVEKYGDNAEIRIDNIDDDHSFRNRKFRGHWVGFEWGINNFLDDGMTLSREGEASFMDLNTGRSWSINLNFAQYSLGFGTSHLGVLTGLGLEYNNYFFDGYNTIAEVNDYVEGVDTANVSKSKLTTSYLRIPLIFEAQFPGSVRAKRIFVSAGIVAGLKMGSHTKIVYKNDAGKSKDKNNDDFNISPFRYGLTARIGCGSLCVFGDYYFTPMFVEGKGPEMHPFSLGLALAF